MITILCEKKKTAEPGYLGGLAAMGASLLTHPLDTIKVQYQAQSGFNKLGLVEMTLNTVRLNGIMTLYNGISAGLLMSATYSTSRFAFYEFAKHQLLERSSSQNKNLKELPFYQKVLIAGIGGALGGFCGCPADVCNIRMQTDIRQSPQNRRNYKHCFDAIYRIVRTEGVTSLYAGLHMAMTRGLLVNIGQLATYDEFKQRLIRSGYFADNLKTHFTASMGAGLIATFITMPVDVIKTLMMNARPGEITSVMQAAQIALRNDPFGLLRGFWPRYVRLGPFTIFAFIFYEKLKVLHKNFFN